MKAELFSVETYYLGKPHVELWETSRPLGLGHPFRWVLEHTPEGIQLRDLSQKAGSVSSSNVVQIDPRTIDEGKAVRLPNHSKYTVKLRRLRPLPPAFSFRPEARRKGPEGHLDQLFAYAGVGRWVTNAQAIHSAYVAYAKGRPVFTLYQQGDGYRVKPLLNKVVFRVRGVEDPHRPSGEEWTLTADELLTGTIARGRHWWRFNLVPVPARVSGDPTAHLNEEQRVFNFAIRGAAAFLLLFLALTWLWPKAQQEDKPPTTTPPAPVVKFQNPIPPARRHEKKAVAMPSAPAPAPAKQQKDKPKEPAKVAKGEVSRPAVVAPPAKSAAATNKTEKNKKAGGNRVGHSKEELAAAAAMKQARQLKEALGAVGVAALTQKTIEHDTKDLEHSAVEGRHGGSSAISPTEVRPGALDSAVRVESIGGNSVGGSGSANGKAGGKAGGVGYATGEHGSVKGQGQGFAKLDTEGSTVDEGLTKEEVGAVIHAHKSEVRYCQESAMLANPKVDGKLVLQFSIDPHGRVETVSTQSSTLPDRRLGDCIIEKLRTWQFPHPRGGIHVSVSYPFVFKTLGKE